jgi:hypothetical protein
MSNSPDRFLRQKTDISKRSALGRVFNVTRETWRLADDPRTVRPDAEPLVTRRTAADAADLAREAAEAYGRHGFHKPSGSWWAADEAHFHRFVVHAGRKGPTAALVLVSGLAGLAALAVVGLRRRPAGGKSADDG